MAGMVKNGPKQKIVVICGATATGKTDFAIQLAEAFSGEIVSADSMQIYRYMDIGTAKPTDDECARIPHHLIDVADPDEHFDAETFSRLAAEAIGKIHGGAKVPLVAGGTGLYIKALTRGLFRTPRVDPDIRRRLKDELERVGSLSMHRRLQQDDPEAAARINGNDAYRILRALEIHEATGRAISIFHREHRFSNKPYHAFSIGLQMDRETLYERIDRRVDRMIDNGLVKEVQGLLDMGYPADLKSMQSIGYRHMGDFLLGRTPWDEAVRTLKRDTRRYAKRQMTWFRGDPDIVWMDPEDTIRAQRRVDAFLSGPGR